MARPVMLDEAGQSLTGEGHDCGSGNGSSILTTRKLSQLELGIDSNVLRP